MVCGLDGDDQILARAGDDVIRGDAGSDVLYGDAGDDRAAGGEGSDFITGEGGGDRLRGGRGHDLISGDAGDDRLFGEPDDDWLEGGTGADFLDGGDGSNRCVTPGSKDKVRRCVISVRSPRSTRLVDYDVAPTTIDTSEAPRAVTVTVAVASTHEIIGVVGDAAPQGVESLHEQVRLYPFELIEGDRRTGVWRTTAVVPRGARRAHYPIRLHAHAADPLVPGGVDPVELVGPSVGPRMAFDQVGQDDTGPPTLVGLSLAPAVLDTSVSAQDLTVSAHVRDELFGTADVGAVLERPNGTRVAMDLTLASGTALDGTWVGSRRLPRHSAPGAYRIVEFTLADHAEKSVSLNRAQLAALGLDAESVQTAPGDVTAPQLVGFDFAPDVFDSSLGGFISASIDATDDLTGVAQATARFGLTSGTAFDLSTGLESGTPTSGHWFGFGGFRPGDLPPGQYPVSVTLEDDVGNSRTIGSDALAAAGFPNVFAVTP